MFYTAPTLLRSLMQTGDQWVTARDRSSLRVLGTVGEPIGEHAWNWFGALTEPKASQNLTCQDGCAIHMVSQGIVD